mmetsp:Transcript_126129/g.243132  ORF Transcript_126129/g.243132 Transcript_126129/m.243132 type:complete len:194 (+) Transcript_126129:98-679(+)
MGGKSSCFSGPIYKGPAPHIHEYCQLKKKIMKEILLPTSKGGKKYEEKMKPMLKTLIEKAFKRHDTKQNGVLDKEEAAVFFQHLVAEESDLLEVAGLEILMEACFKTGNPMLRGLDGKALAEVKRAMEAQLRKRFEEKAEKVRADYKKNKTERDQAGFNVMDVNGDGTLHLQEVVDCLMPGSDKYKAFQEAMG